jgi:hypothetical protein
MRRAAKHLILEFQTDADALRTSNEGKYLFSRQKARSRLERSRERRVSRKTTAGTPIPSLRARLDQNWRYLAGVGEYCLH